MGKIIFFDIFSGCSGDMILSALIDAGLDFESLCGELAKLPISEYEIVQRRVKRQGIEATYINIISHSEKETADRTYRQVYELINSSRLSAQIKKLSTNIFKSIGEAEAHLHSVPIERIHFHEIGAVDSILDIVGSVIGFELMNITDFYSSPFPAGSGYVATPDHGILPLPAPATMEIIKNSYAPVVDVPHQAMHGHELVTPTGAAIISTIAKFERPSFLYVDKIGYGAGTRDFKDYPNILRLWIGEQKVSPNEEKLVLLETNIDDMNPQVYDYVMKKILNEGALDVWLTPIYMKKNRPGIVMSVLVTESKELTIIETLLKETTTLGIRKMPISRHIAQREIIKIDTTIGTVKVKVKKLDNHVLGITPEYDDCCVIAGNTKLPLIEVYRIIENEVHRLIIKDN